MVQAEVRVVADLRVGRRREFALGAGEVGSERRDLGVEQPHPIVQLGDELAATGYDIYDRALVRRDLLVLASELEPGDSGSAVVDANGTVIGLAVAVAPDRSGVAYALDGSGVRQRVETAVSAGGSDAVSTGPCLE